MKNKTFNAKSISSITAVFVLIILIMAVIIAGFVVENYFNQTNNKKSSLPNIQVVAGGLSTNPNILTLTIKNTGNVPVVDINSSMIGPYVGTVALPYIKEGTLSPGQTENVSFTSAVLPSGITAGGQYTVVLSAEGENGASFTTSYIVTAQEAGQIPTNRPAIMLNDTELHANPNVLKLTIINTGNISIIKIVCAINGENVGTIYNGLLAPGQSFAYVNSSSPLSTLSITPGDIYTIAFTVYGSNGMTSNLSYVVMAQ
jgi:hypothetical protein